MKDKIICLVGESGSGKSTIAEILEKEGYNYIQSYTDRPKRYENERGHIFVNQFGKWLVDNQYANIIAETCFDKYSYWATAEQYQGKGLSLYIVDPVGAKDLKSKIKDAEILVIYIKVDEAIRWNRLFERHVKSHGNSGFSYDVDEKARDTASSRVKHDKEAFKIVKCDYIVDNNDGIERTVELIKQIIN